MGRELLTCRLTADNIDAAEFYGKVDAVDTLRRIGKEWLSMRGKCDCGSNAACSVCEIDYLLDEAFRLPGDGGTRASNVSILSQIVSSIGTKGNAAAAMCCR